MRASLSTRLVAAALSWLALLLVGGGVVLAQSFRHTLLQEFEHRLEALLRATIAAVEVSPAGEISLVRPLGEPRFDQIFSGWYWQVTEADGRPLRSRSLWDAALAVHPGEGERQVRRATGPQGEAVLVVEQDVVVSGRRLHVLIAGALSEIREQTRAFQMLLSAALGLLGAGAVAAVLLQVRYGLRPLRRLEAELQKVRAGAAARLGGGHPREVAPLVEAMNAVLDHDAALIERARTHVGNLAHALKTPLSVINAQATDPAVAEQVQAMRRMIEHHLTRAAAAAGSGRALGATVAVAPVMASLRQALLRMHADKRLDIAVAADEHAMFCGQHEDIEELLGNLADNACKWAAGRVRLAAAMEAAGLVLSVEDDGPGMTPAQAEEASRRGARLDEMAPGWGLGLAIVADLVALYGGRLAFARSDLGGLKVTVSLPG